eukprot:gene8145-8338_t
MSYTLAATSGSADPPLPPVLDFHCLKRWMLQPVDHFAAGGKHGSRTWQQVVWVCDATWPSSPDQQEKQGNIIIFAGGEGPLGVPSRPLLFESARRLQALVILVEHRYYGESWPVQPNDQGLLSSAELKWLTAEQVIEDTTAVLNTIRIERGVPAAVPAILVGGSYSGQLAAYHRVMKPSVYAAAVASSAPVDYVIGTPQWAATSNKYFIQIARSADDMSGGPQCSLIIRTAVDTAAKLVRTKKGRATLQQQMGYCPGSNSRSGQELLSHQCTQGFVDAGKLPAAGTPDTFFPKISVTVAEIQQACDKLFGSAIPRLEAPRFAANLRRLIRKTGGVIFTNGEIDTWAGGSWLALSDVQQNYNNSSNSSSEVAKGRQLHAPADATVVALGSPAMGANHLLVAAHAQVAFVVYRKSSHCTDVHNYNWAAPDEPPLLKQQRAAAMDWVATSWGERHRRRKMLRMSTPGASHHQQSGL